MKTAFAFFFAVGLFISCKKQQVIERPDAMSVEALQRLIERSAEIKKVAVFDQPSARDKPILLIEVLNEKPRFESKYEMIVGGKKIDMKRYCGLLISSSGNDEVILWMHITLSDCNNR